MRRKRGHPGAARGPRWPPGEYGLDRGDIKEVSAPKASRLPAQTTPGGPDPRPNHRIPGRSPPHSHPIKDS